MNSGATIFPISPAEIWSYVSWRYDQAMQSADPRTNHWLLVESPWPMLFIVFLYLAVVFYGPKLMKNMRPFELRPLMIAYNLFLVVLNFYMCTEFIFTTSALNYTYTCDTLDYSTENNNVRLASAYWWFYFSKVIELLDTVFFIMRKKHSQVTFLHVYHHSTMVVLWWIGVKWYASGASFFSAQMNTLVHVIMYSYYFLTAFGPFFQRLLSRWKKFLTLLQLSQFFFMLGHVSTVLYLDCDYDKRPQWALVVYLLSHIVLFANFYQKAYSKPCKRTAVEMKPANGEVVTIANGAIPDFSNKKDN